jgi:hypothetical protein
MRRSIVPTWIRVWNRKLHFYVGLYLLLFLWLFSISGLLLNHPKWRFAEFWPQRRETSAERIIQPPTANDDMVVARDLMRQLALTGEIQWMETRPSSDEFQFRVHRPGNIVDVRANLASGRATLKRIRFNAWGVLRVIHLHTGVSIEDPRQTRDWLLTKVWSLSMDALAGGVAFLVLSGLYMWYQLTDKRRLGLAFLSLGVLSCGLYVYGFRWFF